MLQYTKKCVTSVSISDYVILYNFVGLTMVYKYYKICCFCVGIIKHHIRLGNMM